jgi:NAD(P)-dependent dehydrogenase (short-subunit alcohol dehydrogenase family)
MGNLDGKNAIVTGGTGALGSAVTTAFLREGARVFVPYGHEGALDALRASVGAHGDRLEGARVDLRDEDAVATAYRAFVQAQSGLDVLVNVAGGWDGGKPVHETAWSVWQQLLDVNLKTAVLSCKAAAPHLVARGGGSIVNVASRAAVTASPNGAAYASSKRALLSLTEAIAAELHDANVTANAVLPALIDTAKNREAGMTKGAVSPQAIAEVILFLASPAARVVSGAAIPVYG